MATIGEVAVKLGLDSKEFIKEIDKAENECKQLEKNLNETKESFERMSKAMAMTKNPTKEMTSAFNELKNQLKQDQNAFNTFQGRLNKFDGGMSKSTSAVNLLGGALGKIISVGAIITLGKQMIDFGQKSVEPYRIQDRAIKGLNTALQNAGVYTVEYSNHLQKLSSEIQKFSNYGDEAVEKAIGLGQAYAGNIKLTDELIKATVDYAAATETDLQTAFALVGKSIGTETNALARYGVALDKNMSKEEKMAVITQTLEQRFNGSAKAMSDSSTKLKNALGDLSEAFGKWLNPSVEKTQNFLQRGVERLTEWINKVRILHSEIQRLDYEESQTRYKQTLTQLQALDKKRSRQGFLSGPENGKYKQLVKDLTEVEGHIEALNRKQRKLAQDSKTNYVATLPALSGSYSSSSKGSSSKGSSKSAKTPQDKALEEYKKYIEEYKKLTDNYAATLKARQYVEGTLNIDPIKQQEEYTKTLNVYQNYYSQLAEIARSGAKNKAELEKLEEENLARELQELRLAKETETRQKLNEIIKGYKETQKEHELQTKAETELGGFMGSFTVGYKQRLEVLKWYYKERETLQQTHYNNLAEQTEAFNQLEQTKQLKEAEIARDIWKQRGDDIANIFNNTFSNMLTNYGDFSDNMKQLVINLSTYLTKEITKQAFTWLIDTQKNQGTMFTSFTNLLNNLTGSLTQVGQGGVAAATGIQAMQATQTALQPIQAAVGAASATTAAQYIAQATAAQQLASAIAQLAISEAALSIAKIPFVGGFLAPAAAAATGAGIMAAMAMVTAATMFSKVGKVGGLVSSVLPSHHSGGMIPGTKEQIAVLQGGERVLNRSEANSYNTDNAGGGGTTIVNAFNIRAWDGKDVINTLKANAQTINQITASGLKNNNQGLRSIVQSM